MNAVMVSRVADTADLGWEEIVNAAVANLLKHALSKNGNSNTSNISSSIVSQLKLPADSGKLEKQLKAFISKLESGATLLPSVYGKKSGKNY